VKLLSDDGRWKLAQPRSERIIKRVAGAPRFNLIYFQMAPLVEAYSA